MSYNKRTNVKYSLAILIGILIVLVISFLWSVINANYQHSRLENRSIDDYNSFIFVNNGMPVLKIILKSPIDNNVSVKEYQAKQNNELINGYLFEVKKNEYILNFIYRNDNVDVKSINIFFMGKTLEANIDDSIPYVLVTDKFVSKDKFNSNNLIIEELKLNAEYELYNDDGVKCGDGSFVVSDR